MAAYMLNFCTQPIFYLTLNFASGIHFAMLEVSVWQFMSIAVTKMSSIAAFHGV